MQNDSNGYYGNHTVVAHNAPVMLIHHGNQEHSRGPPSDRPLHDGTVRRPSPIQHTTETVAKEHKGKGFGFHLQIGVLCGFRILA